MKKNSRSLFLSILAFVLSALGLILLTTIALVSNYVDSDNWYRIFFNGITKWRVVGITSIYSATGFPVAFTVLSLIGIIAVILGSIYWLIHVLGGKRKCKFSKFKLPGPIVGVFLGLGGLIGFIGSMVFIPYGNNVTGGFNSYASGYIVPTVILGLFLLVGAFILFTSKKGKKSSKKKKR
ncbi:MAG: hypothetical protein FK730_07025 [Asgard group archaeon]|nr:hypothetical protein [Asgard group archaeon]